MAHEPAASVAPRSRGVYLSPSPWPRRVVGGVVQFARRKPLGFSGLLMLFLVCGAALLAPLLAPYGYADVDFTGRLEGPSRDHLLGTDNLGRDTLSRLLYGSRVSLGISFAAVILSKVSATMVAVVSGYYGGWIDKIVQRFVDIWIGLPTLIILITIISLTGPGIVGLTVIIAITIAPNSSRLVRSVVLQVRSETYIEAARSIGVSDRRIMLRYILPNVAHIVIFSATVSLGAVILSVASLGFLGYGVPPPFPDLGGMLSGDGLTFMRRQPWLALWPGIVITVIVFGFNVFGDALRDVLDPKLRGR
ncbi:MAG: ABC transporter permease subunit [Dehalococcoidia bacterium]|nr:ABC transporter permease subunit [Dehalococcoidia bacterium]